MEAVAGYLIKLLGFVPGIKSWLVRRFGRMEITPINQQGVNIFHKRQTGNTFFVKLHFHIRANAEMEILNMDFQYGPGFIPVSRYVWDDNNKLKTDSYFRLIDRITLKPREMHHVALQTDFVPSDSMEDYDKVMVEFEISSPGVRGIVNKVARFQLAPRGALEPSSTQRI